MLPEAPLARHLVRAQRGLRAPFESEQELAHGHAREEAQRFRWDVLGFDRDAGAEGRHLLPSEAILERRLHEEVGRATLPMTSTVAANMVNTILAYTLVLGHFGAPKLGIAGAAILGLARALGETMAVTMVIGNSSRKITGSLLTPGYTMASAIANQFNEADNELYFSAVVGVAAILLVVSALVNLFARFLIWSITRNAAQGARA